YTVITRKEKRNQSKPESLTTGTRLLCFLVEDTRAGLYQLDLHIFDAIMSSTCIRLIGLGISPGMEMRFKPLRTFTVLGAAIFVLAGASGFFSTATALLAAGR